MRTASSILDTLFERTRAAIKAAKLERLLPTLDYIERTQRPQLLQMVEEAFADLLASPPARSHYDMVEDSRPYPDHGRTWLVVRNTLSILTALTLKLNTLDLQNYVEGLHVDYFERKRRVLSPWVYKYEGVATPAKARIAVEKALHTITRIGPPLIMSPGLKDAAILNLQRLLETITLMERRAFYSAAAALGFDDMSGEIEWGNSAVEAPVEAPGDLLLGDDASPRELLVFHLHTDSAPLTRPGDRYLLELGHPANQLRFAVARHYPLSDDGSYLGTPTRLLKSYPHLFAGEVDVLIFEEKNKKLVEYTPDKALALLRKEGARRDPLRVGDKLGFERVEEGLLEQRSLQLFLPALSRKVEGRVKEGAPRFTPMNEAQISAALHLGPSSRPFLRLPDEPGDLYLLRTEALKPVDAPAWLTNEVYLLCQIASAKDLLSGRVKYASWGDDRDRDRDAYQLQQLASAKDASLLLAPVYGFVGLDALGPDLDLPPRPRAAATFLERLDQHYRKHGQNQRPQEILRALID